MPTDVLKMTVEIQYCIKNNDDFDESVVLQCDRCGEGVLYYPDVDVSDIGHNMESFYAISRCTECDEYYERINTAPRYLCWRVVVRT